jgi:hypothetical protein
MKTFSGEVTESYCLVDIYCDLLKYFFVLKLYEFFNYHFSSIYQSRMQESLADTMGTRRAPACNEGGDETCSPSRLMPMLMPRPPLSNPCPSLPPGSSSPPSG